MIIVNVIYFKGKWLKPFKISKTHKRAFTKFGTLQYKNDFIDEIFSNNTINKITKNNTICNIDFMSGVFSGKFYEDKYVKVAVKPYYDGFSLTIIHPKQNFDNIIPNLQYPTKQENKIRLIIPKIKQEYDINLKSVLEPYISNAFNFSNDFNPIIKIQMKVDDIQQKVIVHINESGTEATAITRVMAASCAPSPIRTLIADSPFIWYIKDSNNIIYFSGVYNGE